MAWHRKSGLAATLLLATVFMMSGSRTGMAHKKKSFTTAGVRYSTHIAALVAAKCLDCHGEDSPEHRNFTMEDAAKGVGPRLDSYSHLAALIGWPDTGLLQRNIDAGGSGAKPGKMYRYLGEDEEERQKNLALFKSWIGQWTLKSWPNVTIDDLVKLKLPY